MKCPAYTPLQRMEQLAAEIEPMVLVMTETSSTIQSDISSIQGDVIDFNKRFVDVVHGNTTYTFTKLIADSTIVKYVMFDIDIYLTFTVSKSSGIVISTDDTQP